MKRSLAVSRSALNQRWQPWAWFQRSANTPLGLVRTNRYCAQSWSLIFDGSDGRAIWASPPQRNSISGRGPQWGQVTSSMGASMGDRRRRRLVDEAAGAEAVQGEGRGDGVRLAPGDGVGEHVAGARRRLE